MLIANIIKIQQPEIYKKLLSMVSETHGLQLDYREQPEYREQPAFPEDDLDFVKIRNLMQEKRSVKM